MIYFNSRHSRHQHCAVHDWVIHFNVSKLKGKDNVKPILLSLFSKQSFMSLQSPNSLNDLAVEPLYFLKQLCFRWKHFDIMISWWLNYKVWSHLHKDWLFLPGILWSVKHLLKKRNRFLLGNSLFVSHTMRMTLTKNSHTHTHTQYTHIKQKSLSSHPCSHTST